VALLDGDGHGTLEKAVVVCNELLLIAK
jgi:hypothetical protein